MPENYIAMFDVTGPEESVRMLKAAKPVVESAAECIRQGREFPKVHLDTLGWLKSGVVNRGFYAACVSAKKFRATDACVSCGKCGELCPLGNIKLQDGKPVWGDRCTHCMACISYCPTNAIEYGKRSVGKQRYRCEDYTK